MQVSHSVMLIPFILSTGCSVFGIRSSEELPYTVLYETDGIEVRDYPAHLAAQTTSRGEDNDTQGKLFRRLANFIFGGNSGNQSIAMTAPVITGFNRDRNIGPSTVPPAPKTESSTHQVPELEHWHMRFSMPASFRKDTLPTPIDPKVEIVEVGAQTVLASRFSGSFNDSRKRLEHIRRLEAWLEANPNYESVGEPLFAGYDPPFTIPYFRRNEVLFRIKNVTPVSPAPAASRDIQPSP